MNKNKIALLLMGISLGLLCIFLSWWLWSAYQEEVSRLEEKSSFVFLNTLREAETDFIKKEFLAPLLQREPGSGDSVQLRAFRIGLKGEHTGKKAVYELTDSSGVNQSTKVKIEIDHRQEVIDNPQGGGAYLTWILEAFQESSPDSFPILDKDSFMLSAIRKVVAGSPVIADLPGQFRVIKVADTLQDQTLVRSASYVDVDSGGQFALAFDHFDGYIFQKILPQIGFAVLLFAVTTLAFFFFYKNLMEQQKLTRLKNDLISNITHELKTPIATVRVALEAMQNFGALDNPQKTTEYLDISQRELNRLSILVDKVLNTSLFEKSDFPIKKENINLKVLIEDVLKSLKLQFQSRKASVAFETTGSDFSITADRTHLTNVVYNLVDNALKYSPENPNITIHLDQKVDEISLSVKDSGLGIPEEYQDKIFEKFFRIPQENQHSVKGHGLGLNYVRQVIEKHKGIIQLTSEAGKGTCLKVVLPAAKSM